MKGRTSIQMDWHADTVRALERAAANTGTTPGLLVESIIREPLGLPPLTTAQKDEHKENTA